MGEPAEAPESPATGQGEMYKTVTTTTRPTTKATTLATTKKTYAVYKQPSKKPAKASSVSKHKNKGSKGKSDNQCPDPTNKLSPDVLPAPDCANRSAWWKNYTCKLYCANGKRPQVSDMKCRCKSARQCSWWARKVRGKVVCK